MWLILFHFVASQHIQVVFFTGSRVPENKFSLTYFQQHVAENRAEPVRTMAASFARKPFLFSEVLSTVLGRVISEIDSQYAENMRYSHPRWGCPNGFSGKHFSVENGVLTIDSEKFQSIFGYGNKFSIAGNNWHNTKQKGPNLTLPYNRSRSTQGHHLNKLGSTRVPELHTNSQGHRPFGSREEDFLWFLSYMGIVAILVKWHRPFE